MFKIRKESDKIQQGFNFYPLNDPSSFGFIFRIKNVSWWFRYSKYIKKWIIGKKHIDNIHIQDSVRIQTLTGPDGKIYNLKMPSQED